MKLAEARLSMNTIMRRVAKSEVLLTVGSSFVIQALVMVTGITSARLLGPEGRGELALVLLWPNLVAALGDLGLQTATARYSVGKQEDAGSTLAIGLCAGGLSGVLSTVVGSVLIFSLIPESLKQLSLFYLAASTIVAIIRQPFIGLLRGQGRFVIYNASRVLLVLPYFLGILAFAVLGIVSVETVMLANLLGIIGSTLLSALAVLLRTPLRRFTWSEALALLRYGLVVHIGTIASSETVRIDLIIISLALPLNDIGLYTAASSVMFLPRLIGQSIGIIALTEQTGSKENSRVATLLIRYQQTLVLTAIVTLLLMIIADPLIRVAFGSDFSQAGGTAAILILGGALTSIRRVLGDCLRAVDRHRSATLSELLALTTAVVLTFPLVSIAGIQGAAAAQTMSNGISLLLVLYLAKTGLGLHWADLLPHAAFLPRIRTTV